MGKEATPKNWPGTMPFLLQPVYARHLTTVQNQALRTRSVDLSSEIPPSCPRGPCSLVKITSITDNTHPAYRQCGLFAARYLPPGSLILPYYGIAHSSLPPHNVAHENSDYDLWLDREAGIALDAGTMGNEARFVNDYRGVQERPNAEFCECWDMRRGEKCMGVFVLPASKNAVAKKGGTAGICKGEEILVSYGKGFWGNRKEDSDSGV